jgi:hypothetical protein
MTLVDAGAAGGGAGGPAPGDTTFHEIQ